MADREPAALGVIRAVDRAVAKIEEIVLALLVIALVLVGVYQAARRNYWTPAPFWSPEVIKYSVLFIGLLGGALAAQSDKLINIDMLTRILPARGRLAMKVLTAIFTIVICWMFAKGSFAMMKGIRLEKGEVLAPAKAMWALPIGAWLIGLHMALHALIDVYYLGTGRTPPEPTQAAGPRL